MLLFVAPVVMSSGGFTFDSTVFLTLKKIKIKNKSKLVNFS